VVGLVVEGGHERETIDNNSTEEHEDVEEYGRESGEQKGWV